MSNSISNLGKQQIATSLTKKVVEETKTETTAKVEANTVGGKLADTIKYPVQGPEAPSVVQGGTCASKPRFNPHEIGILTEDEDLINESKKLIPKDLLDIVLEFEENYK